jgi:hypothetical protein
MKHDVSEKVPASVFRKENNLLWWTPYIDIFYIPLHQIRCFAFLKAEEQSAGKMSCIIKL